MFNFYLQSRRSYVIQSGHCVSVSRPVALQQHILAYSLNQLVRLLLKCDGTRAETRFRLSAKRTSPLKSAGASVQSTTGSRGAPISGSNVGYAMFRGSVKGTVYPLHLPVSPSVPLPCVTAYHHISTGVYSFLLEAESTSGPPHKSGDSLNSRGLLYRAKAQAVTCVNV